jgi:hypothetical protein
MKEKVMDHSISNLQRLCLRWCIAIIFLILPACSYTPYITHTKKSGTEQLLVAKALDDALKGVTLDIRGAKIILDVASLMEDEEHYIEKALTHWFLKNGALITKDEKQADLTASVLVKCAGTDGEQFFFGLPSLPIPLTIVGTPQINILSGSKQEGHAELEIILYQSKEGLKEKTPSLVGKSYFKKYTILFIPITKENIY